MTAFDKAWDVVKGNQVEDDNETSMELRGEPLPEGEQLCDGLSIAETGENLCQGDGLIGEGGGYECSSCQNLHCPDCHHSFSLTPDQENFEDSIKFKDTGLEFSYGTDLDSALDHAGLGDASNMCGHCIEHKVPDAIDNYVEYVQNQIEEEETEQREGQNIRDKFNQKVDEAPSFGDNRGKTLFSDESPHFHSKFNPDWQKRVEEEKDFNPDWQDKLKSKDSFEMAWGIVKEAPTEECKGCGLAHGTPNSEYCSEICEKQNMKKSDDPLGDALENARNTPRKDLKLTKLPKDVAIKLNRRVKDPSKDPLVQRAKKNLDEEKEERNKR